MLSLSHCVTLYAMGKYSQHALGMSKGSVDKPDNLSIGE